MGWFRIFYRVGFIEILRSLSFAQRSFIFALAENRFAERDVLIT